MKQQVMQFITDFCTNHRDGSAFIYANARYVASRLNIKKQEVINSIPPIFDSTDEDAVNGFNGVIFWTHLHYGAFHSLDGTFNNAEKNQVVMKKRLLKSIAIRFPELKPEVRVPPAWVTKALAAGSNDFDPQILKDDLSEGEITGEEYKQLYADSTVAAWQAAWQDSAEYFYRMNELAEADTELYEGKITQAEYNRREKKFYISLKKRGIQPFLLRNNNPAPVAKAQTSRAPKKPARRAARSSAKSGDSNAPDPEPEPPRLYFTYQSFAQLVDCTTRTLYNKVSTGQFPRPVKTAFGPRFTQKHLDSVIKATPTSTGGRGRPRIADSIQGGVQ